MLVRIYRDWLKQGVTLMVRKGCPRCAGSVQFIGDRCSCMTCGWELIGDGYRPDMAVA